MTERKHTEDDDSACTNKTTHFYEFKEYDQLMGLIKSLPDSINDLRTKEKSYEQFLYIIDMYQEQPHLIDPFLSEIFDELIKIVKNCIKKEQDDKITELINESFKYIHTLAKMRGYKKIVQYLPHEITDFEPVLKLLERQDIKNVYSWQTRFILLLWLSIICIVPFDLERFDALGQNQNETISNRLLNTTIPYLFSSDKCQEASAFLLAKFMSRQDIQKNVLPKFFEQLFNFLKESKKESNAFKLLGTLKCIANIYKYGKREDLLIYTLPTFRVLCEQDLLSNNLAQVRKLYIKILQRIGTCFFKVKIAKWRYERGSRILMNNISKQDNLANNIFGQNKQEKSRGEFELEESEEDEVPNEIEEIIEQLLNGLKDKDTIVRWSSAKGIGRITNRLSKEMADDILQSLLELFTFVEDDSAWHGSCLAIAELGRRGLLLPKQLKSVVPIILKALVFDKKLGNYSLGRNVRDSACYVCWAFARAFEPEVIKQYVNELAGALLIVSVFDREINCRRAASAAFQENVGRQGQFPHGIDILTRCDYYAVGQIQNCFLELSFFIAEFDEYRKQIIDHLLEHKFNHWDHTIRDLTSQALYKLTPLCPDYMCFSLLPKLFKLSLSIDLNVRHGAILCLAQIIHSLCNLAFENKKLIEKYFNQEFISELKNLASKIFDEKYFRGSSGEYMRPAVCFLFKKLSLSRLFELIELNEIDDNFINKCESFLIECIEYNKDTIQQAAVETISYFCDLKLIKLKSQNLDLNQNFKIVEVFIKNLKETGKDYVRSGYCLALGNFPCYLLEINNNFIKCAETLISASKCVSGPIDSIKTNKIQISVPKSVETITGWVQAKKDAIKGLINLFDHVQNETYLSNFGLNNTIFMNVFETFLNGLNDYSNDPKGDTGSRVREASTEALEFLLILCSKLNLSSITSDLSLIEKIFSGIIQQAVERIDRTRNIAGRTFFSLLYNKNLGLEKFSFINKLRSVFKKEECEQIDWNLAYVTLPLFIQLINTQEFQNSVLIGFVYSIGALTESLVKTATNVFIKELRELEKKDENEYKILIERLLNLCKLHLKIDRLSCSLIKTVDLVIQNGLLNNHLLIENEYPIKFLNVFLENVKLTKDMQRLLSYTDFFCDILQFEDEKMRRTTMSQLMIMLCHDYSRVRKAIATKLFESLINLPDLFDNESDNDECITLLTETDWDEPIEKLRLVRNRLCDLTKTPKPIIKKISKPE